MLNVAVKDFPVHFKPNVFVYLIKMLKHIINHPARGQTAHLYVFAVRSRVGYLTEMQSFVATDFTDRTTRTTGRVRINTNR